MDDKTMCGVIREVMNAYDSTRKLWIEEFGDDSGFDKWFSTNVCKGHDKRLQRLAVSPTDTPDNHIGRL